jgi:IS5 family transposase
MKRQAQRGLDFSRSHLSITNEYYAKYEAISSLLDKSPEIVDLVHKDLSRPLARINRKGRAGGRRHLFTSENVLRILLCQVIEGESLRGVVVRIDDSHFLRRFVGVDNGPMMDFTTLCKLRNAIRARTWHRVNRQLAEVALDRELIEGTRLRIDTTAVETNIHWPTDSWLLWDVYRVLARLIVKLREFDADLVGPRRLQTRRAKRLQQKIARRAVKKGHDRDRLKPQYSELIRLVEALMAWTDELRVALKQGSRDHSLDAVDLVKLEAIGCQMDRYVTLGRRVVHQARRRVLQGESVPNAEKLFSIFEEHTELLKRGKAGKEIEFGHMVQIEQVDGKFITGYDVYETKPIDHEEIHTALERHVELFGEHPHELAADKGYYESTEALADLRTKVRMVSIAKKGRRTEEETALEHDPLFRHAQRFRAGIEGTISFLKRILRLARCINKGWQHFVATIAQTVFAHNLLILARC